MSDAKEIITTGPASTPALPAAPSQPANENPFMARALAAHANAGTVAIEEARAVAEAQGKLIIAKRFPRDPARAWASIMEACRRPGLAAIAEYSFPRGNERVTGPSIRLAEELARCWGNVDYGIRELSRKDGVSEMEAYAWDVETNTISSQKFTVRHVRDTRQGQKALTDERDVYELTANMAGRRLRARIMAILPADIVDAAVQECRKTLAGNNTKPLTDRVRDMLGAFDRLGVSAAHIERWLEKPLTAILPEDFAELTAIYNSIKDGVSKASDWFEVKVAGDQPAVADLNAQIRAAQPAIAADQPAARQQPAAAPQPAQPEQPAPAVAPAAATAKPGPPAAATPPAPVAQGAPAKPEPAKPAGSSNDFF